MNKNNRRTFFLRSTFLVVTIALIGTAGYFYFQPNNKENTQVTAKRANQPANGVRRMPLAPVRVAPSVDKVVPRFVSGLGTVQAANTVTVTSRVEGQLISLHFIEGQQVKAGDLLATIDPRPFEIQRAQAEGQLAKDQALLTNARLDLARFQKLSNTQVISQQELDNQKSLVKQIEASIRVDQAALDNAKLQLTYSKIVAPISGRVGLKQVDVGNFIASGSSNPLVVITQTYPVDVLFSLPEDNIPAIQQAQKTTKPVLVEAWDRNNLVLVASGALLSIDNQIDPATGTLKMKARFTNEDESLFPNQFVNIKLQVETLQNAIVIPSAALQMGNEGHYVWVLNDDQRVSKTLVTVGMQNAQQVVIEQGLSAGAKVVTDGVDRLTEGAQVEVISSTDKVNAKQEKSAKAGKV
nr:MdtA/MuxA family multidrug efflux RND transporter periplasmic adaptor subunit [uncultured Moellerella sp.]